MFGNRCPPPKKYDGAVMHQNTENDNFFNKVSINLVTNVFRTVVMAILGLVMVPYYISKFGLSDYALIPLATTITSYVLVISDSLAESFSRYMTISVQGKGDDNVNKIYTSSIIGMGKCMAVFIPACLIIALVSPYIFQTGTIGTLDVQILFFCILLSSILVSYSACFSCVFMAYNKLYITYIDKTIYIVLQVILVILFFNIYGPSMSLIGISYIIAVLVMIAIMYIQVKRLKLGFKVKKCDYDNTLLRKMFNLA